MQNLPRTLWYMGVKARVLPDFLSTVLDEEVPPGGTVMDLMSGTGIVAAYCANRYKVFANDVEEYAAIVARSLIEHDPEEKEEFLRRVKPRQDLSRAYQKNLAALEAYYAGPLAREEELLAEFQGGRRDGDWCQAYRDFLESPGSVYGHVAPSNRKGDLYASARDLLTEESLEHYREDPDRRPGCLVTAYYANIYFGLRQAVALDSLRSAIADLKGSTRLAEQKRVHYLSALLHTASISTSGTSHFAQPRHTVKDSELFAMATRRQVDIFGRFEEWSQSILETVGKIRHTSGNRCFSGDYKQLVKDPSDGAGSKTRQPPAFALPDKLDLVYFDPPYTSDNYSRFYHVLNVMARYDYPALDRDRKGQILRGRYPVRERRFISGFCSKVGVEDEFRRVVQTSAASGAKLVISYASPTGLLLKCFSRRFPQEDPVRRLEDLCRESYRDVETRRLSLRHSGQGDSNISVEELLVVCRKPRIARKS